MRKRKYELGVSLHKSIIRIIVLLLCFIVIGVLSIQLIRHLFYEDIKRESSSIIDNYADKLSNSSRAVKTINDLMDNRLELAAELIANSSNDLSHVELNKLVEEYNLWELNIYDQNMTIIKSNRYKQIGWEIPEGHPAYDFFINYNGEKTFIENIRKDYLSDRYVKYIYRVNEEGYIVQMGFSADEYYKLIEHFQIERILKELNQFSNIVGALFIDNNLNVVHQESSINNYEFNLDYNRRLAIQYDEEYFDQAHGHEELYDLMKPVYRDDNKLGTLALSYSIGDLAKKIRWIYFLDVTALVFLFILTAKLMYSIYIKNEKLEQLVYYDGTTGLPNLDYLEEYYRGSIYERKEGENNEDQAVILIDIINYNLISLIHGYEEGKDLLKQATKQVNTLLADNEILFKVGESKFVIFVDQYKDKEHLRGIAEEITFLFDATTKDSSIDSHVSVQIGINEIEDNQEDILNILKNAQIAAQEGNTNNDCSCSFFNARMGHEIQRKKKIENEIESFIKEENNNIYLVYQPQLDLQSNRISGLEALARMKSEELGQISPVEFISIAEESNLIIGLGLILLKEACIFLNKLNKQGFKDIIVAVNVSVKQILRHDFADNVMKIIEETNIKASNLEIEITESEVADKFDIVNMNLAKLKSIGISIALDDFGTGYSSLERLRMLSIDRLKIDKTFIDRISETELEKVIVGDIISLSHKLGLKTVAEGVEEEEQKRYLINNKCDIMQGYLFSKPVSQEEVLKMLKE